MYYFLESLQPKDHNVMCTFVFLSLKYCVHSNQGRTTGIIPEEW